jgi:pyridoxal phosphate enzyme (YggS family)
MSIQEQIKSIRKSLPDDVTLIAVSKTHGNELIMEAYAQGVRDFGENKVQELCTKAEQLPKDIQWHMIGHLQSNKVKYIAPFIHLIHSVDSLKLLKEINKQALANQRIVDVLLQIYIAKEETKFGLSYDECTDLFSNPELKVLKNINIRGLMAMASFSDDKTIVSNEFLNLRQFYEVLKQKMPNDFNILCMGMSNDYELAIQAGSNMVRIGSLIFGKRNYS